MDNNAASAFADEDVPMNSSCDAKEEKPHSSEELESITDEGIEDDPDFIIHPHDLIKLVSHDGQEFDVPARHLQYSRLFRALLNPKGTPSILNFCGRKVRRG